MNTSFFRVVGSFGRPVNVRKIVAGLVALSVLTISVDAAPITQTWNSATGTWVQGTDTTVGPKWSGGYWTGGNDIAAFSGTPGTVTVNNTDGSVVFTQLNFNGSTQGAWDITGDALTRYSYLDYSANTFIALNIANSQKGSVTIDSALNLDDSANAAATSNQVFQFYNGSLQGTLTFNGAINLTSTGAGDLGQRSLYFDTNVNNTTSTTASTNVLNLNSKISGVTGDTIYVALGSYAGGTNYANQSASVYNLGSTFSLTGTGSTLNISSGTVYTSSASLGAGAISMNTNNGTSTAGVLGETRALLTVGGLTITNNININGYSTLAGYYGTMTLGGSDSSNSIFSGNITANNATGLALTAASGGTATFSGVIASSSAGATYITKLGAGKVVLSGANTYTTTVGASTVGTVAADIQQGTVQIDNTSGSAFGGSAASTVSLEAGATLSGTGISTQKINVMAANSVIAPGDGPTGQVLKLYGGINAANGLTMNFTIDALGNDDAIDTKQGISVFGGTITLNFTSSAPDGSVLTGHEYDVVIATGGGNWTEAPGTIFTVNGPAGYTGTADFDSAGILSVTFATAPEPSTWAMLLGGVGLLAISLRRLKARA